MQSDQFKLPVRRESARKRSFSLFKVLGYVLLIAALVTVAVVLPLRWVDPPTSSYIQRYEQTTLRSAKHYWVDFEKMAWQIPLAVIAAEDQQFPVHWGLDFKQIRLALRDNGGDKTPRGASTISQQTIKNLYLWPSRSLVRKGIEAWLTLWMELLLPKKRILEIYLNIAQFGKSVFGVGAASRYYFGKQPYLLNGYEASLLAGALPTPSSSDPASPSAYLNQRSQNLRKQMKHLGGEQFIIDL